MSTIEQRDHLLEFLAGLPAAGGVESLDSLGLLQVILYLEDTYGIRLTDHRIEAAELRSVDGLLSIVDRCALDAGTNKNAP